MSVKENQNKVAVRQEIDPDAIKRYLEITGVAKNLTDDELKEFLHICQLYQLNPARREVYAVKYKDDFSVVTSYEVYLKRATATGLLKHMGVSLAGSLKNGDLRAIATIERADWEKPFVWEAWYFEAVGLNRYGKPTKFWEKRPFFMLKKVALAQGLRLLFPEAFDGLPYTSDEISYDPLDTTYEEVKDAPPEQQPPEPSPTEPKTQSFKQEIIQAQAERLAYWKSRLQNEGKTHAELNSLLRIFKQQAKEQNLEKSLSIQIFELVFKKHAASLPHVGYDEEAKSFVSTKPAEAKDPESAEKARRAVTGDTKTENDPNPHEQKDNGLEAPEMPEPESLPEHIQDMSEAIYQNSGTIVSGSQHWLKGTIRAFIELEVKPKFVREAKAEVIFKMAELRARPHLPHEQWFDFITPEMWENGLKDEVAQGLLDFSKAKRAGLKKGV